MFFLSLRQLGGRWRILLILFLASLPMALAALVAATLGNEESFDKEFTDTLIDGLLIAGIMPIVMMVLATAAFGRPETRGPWLPRWCNWTRWTR